MDKFHALVLSGDLSIPDFSLLLKRIDFEPKDRYYGKDVIEKIYGSVQDAYMRFETKYYEMENIRIWPPFVKRIRTRKSEIRQVIAFVEFVVQDPSLFLISNGDRSEAQGDDVSRQEQD